VNAWQNYVVETNFVFHDDSSTNAFQKSRHWYAKLLLYTIKQKQATKGWVD